MTKPTPADAEPSRDGAGPAGRPAPDADDVPRHTLPWWTRAARRVRLSVAKRLVSPRTRRAGRFIPGLRAWSQRVERGLERTRVTVCGAPFRIDLRRRSVSRSIYLGGRWHEHVIAMLHAQLRPGMTMADVGANVGLMAVHAGEAVGPAGIVLAFEPEARNFALLEENARHARARNIVPIAAAVGERDGTIDLFVSARDGGDHRTVAAPDARPAIRVPLVSLDEEARRRGVTVNFAKLDIQGAEGQALRGMRATMRAQAFSGLVIEFWPDTLRAAGEDPLALLAEIRGAGLSCASHPALERDPAAFVASIERGGACDLLFVRN